MYGSKKWYESKAVWGGIVSIVAVAAGFFGYTVTPQDQQQVVAAMSGIGALVGSLVAVWGRIVAERRIGR